VSDRAAGALSLKMHHYAIVVPDLDEAVGWYGDKLDFGVERSFGFSEAGTRITHLVNENGLRIEVIEREGSTVGPDADRDVFDALLVQGSKHIGFLVEDIGAAADELRRRGVEFVMEPNVVEPAGVANFWIRDPAGTLIEFDQWLA